MTKNHHDNYSDALAYVSNLERVKGIKLGLENVLKLLSLMKNPQENLKTIHVAGTNGKGSVSAMIASILSEAGFTVGLYTSPHLVDFRERITIGGEKISGEDFARVLNGIKPFIPDDITSFEAVTAIMFQYFYEKSVDFAVLEVGMGGRLDATNVTKPLVSVITNIALEHEEYLGKTILQIAGEKAGIIKENGVLVTAEKNKDALDLIKKICAEKNTKIIHCGENGENAGCEFIKYNLYSQEFYYISGGEESGGQKIKIKFSIPLIGKHQLDNASCAVSAVKALKRYGIEIPDEVIYSGLKKTKWDARFQIARENPFLIVDAAHNPDGISSLLDALSDFKKISGYKNLILITGILKSKDFKKMLEIIAPAANGIILVKPETPLALDTNVMHEHLMKLNIKNVLIIEKVSDAIKYALSKADPDDAICVAGSLYTAGEALKFTGRNKT